MNKADKLRDWHTLPHPIDGAVVQVRKNTGMTKIGIRPVDPKTNKACGAQVTMSHSEWQIVGGKLRLMDSDAERTTHLLTMCGYLPKTGMILA